MKAEHVSVLAASSKTCKYLRRVQQKRGRVRDAAASGEKGCRLIQSEFTELWNFNYCADVKPLNHRENVFIQVILLDCSETQLTQTNCYRTFSFFFSLKLVQNYISLHSSFQEMSIGSYQEIPDYIIYLFVVALQ